MKKFATATCVAALFLASSAAADLAQEAQSLKVKALSDTTAWDVLESLTTEVGPRSVGTPAIVRAKDWGIAKLTAMGFENVHAEPFTSAAWVRGGESAEVMSPYPQKLSILGLGWSARSRVRSPSSSRPCAAPRGQRVMGQGWSHGPLAQLKLPSEGL